MCIKYNPSNAVIYNSRHNAAVHKNSLEQLLKVKKELYVSPREFAHMPVYLILK